MINKGCHVAKQTVKRGKPCKNRTEDDKTMTKHHLVFWSKKGHKLTPKPSFKSVSSIPWFSTGSKLYRFF